MMASKTEKKKKAVLLRREFQLKNFGFGHENPCCFVEPQCGRPSILYLAWKLLAALYFTVVLVYGSIIWKYGAKWFIFISNWTYLLTVIHSILQFSACVYHYRKYRIRGEEVPYAGMPALWKLNWLLYTLLLVVSPIVAIGYWLAIYDGQWDLSMYNITSHAISAIYYMIELWVGGCTVRVLHFWVPILYGLLYALFTYLYFIGGGTDIFGKEALYPYLNYDRYPNYAVMLIVAMVVLTFIVHLIMYAIFRFKRAMHKRHCCSPCQGYHDMHPSDESPDGSTTDGDDAQGEPERRTEPITQAQVQDGQFTGTIRVTGGTIGPTGLTGGTIGPTGLTGGTIGPIGPTVTGPSITFAPTISAGTQNSIVFSPVGSIGPQMGAPMGNLGQPMGSMGQPMPMGSVSQSMNFVGQPMGSVNQPMGNVGAPVGTVITAPVGNIAVSIDKVGVKKRSKIGHVSSTQHYSSAPSIGIAQASNPIYGNLGAVPVGNMGTFSIGNLGGRVAPLVNTGSGMAVSSNGISFPPQQISTIRGAGGGEAVNMGNGVVVGSGYGSGMAVSSGSINFPPQQISTIRGAGGATVFSQPISIGGPIIMPQSQLQSNGVMGGIYSASNPSLGTASSTVRYSMQVGRDVPFIIAQQQ